MMDYEVDIEAIKREARAAEYHRIVSIFNYSFERHKCRCEACNIVADSLVYHPLKDGHFASVREAWDIIDKTAHCAPWGHA